MAVKLGEVSQAFLQKLAEKGLTIADIKRNPTILQAITETKALDRPEPLTVTVPNIREAKAGTVRAEASPAYKVVEVAHPIAFKGVAPTPTVPITEPTPSEAIQIVIQPYQPTPPTPTEPTPTPTGGVGVTPIYVQEGEIPPPEEAPPSIFETLKQPWAVVLIVAGIVLMARKR